MESYNYFVSNLFLVLCWDGKQLHADALKINQDCGLPRLLDPPLRNIIHEES